MFPLTVINRRINDDQLADIFHGYLRSAHDQKRILKSSKDCDILVMIHTMMPKVSIFLYSFPIAYQIDDSLKP